LRTTPLVFSSVIKFVENQDVGSAEQIRVKVLQKVGGEIRVELFSEADYFFLFVHE